MVHIGERGSPGFREIRSTLRKVRVELGQSAERLQTENPSWNRLDARLTAFAKLANTVESAELALKFQSEMLMDLQWWRANYTPLPSPADLKIYITEFAQFAKVGLLQLGFGAVESSLRVFLRALDPEACSQGAAEFKSIYDCLLRSKLGFDGERVALLDLLRHLRNSVHNHGVYYRRSGSNAVVHYGGLTYQFVHGQPVTFATWLLIAQLFFNAAQLLDDVVSANEVASIAGQVRDPTSLVVSA